MPPDALGDTERLLLVKTIDEIGVLRGGDDIAAAMRGDAASEVASEPCSLNNVQRTVVMVAWHRP